MWFWTLCRKRYGIMYEKAWFLIDYIIFNELKINKLDQRMSSRISYRTFHQNRIGTWIFFFGWDFVKGHLFAWSWFPRNFMKCNDIKVPKIVETQVKVLKWPSNNLLSNHFHRISFTVTYLIFICWQRGTQV